VRSLNFWSKFGKVDVIASAWLLGVYQRTGNSIDLIGVIWQYRWEDELYRIAVFSHIDYHYDTLFTTTI